jgi:hypothetical protein
MSVETLAKQSVSGGETPGSILPIFVARLE